MKNIYTPAADAAVIVAERAQNTALRQKISEYLGGVVPAALAVGKPRALLLRYVARGTTEDLRFADTALEAGLEPYWATYEADRFTTRNPEKVDTVRPPIAWAKGQRTRRWVVAPEQRTGGVGRLPTVYGMSSSVYQGGIRRAVFERAGVGAYAGNTYDVGDWYALQADRFGYPGEGPRARYYYPVMMAWAALNAVFEDYDGGPNAGGGDLAAFLSEIVVPAYTRVQTDLGVDPVIVRLPYEPGMNETNLSFLNDQRAQRLQTCGTIEAAI